MKNKPLSKAQLKTILAEIEEHASRQNRASDNKEYLLWDIQKIDDILSKHRDLKNRWIVDE